MTPLVIDRGIFRFGTKDKPGSTWESNPAGRTILIGDLIEDSENPGEQHIDNASMFNVFQRLRIMDEIAKRLQLPPRGEPDVRDLAMSLMEEEGVCICTACPGPGNCEWCEVDAMVEELGGHYAGKTEEGAAGTVTDIEKAIVEFEDFLAGEKGPGNLHISSVITALTVLRRRQSGRSNMLPQGE